MTDKELRKLSKTEILQLLVSFSQEVDELHQQINSLSAQLEEKNRQLAQAGITVQSSLQLAQNMQVLKEAAALYIQEHADLHHSKAGQQEMPS